MASFIRARSSARNMHMQQAPASVSDRLEELEKRLDSVEKRLLPTANVIVKRFFLACTEPCDGAETAAVDIFHRYERWCREHYPLDKLLDIKAFGEQFDRCCRLAGIETRRIKTLYYVDVALCA
jgi:hypothetical protein